MSGADRRARQAQIAAEFESDSRERLVAESKPAIVAPIRRPALDKQYHCACCHQLKSGRFVRGSGHGWSQGLTQPTWKCFDCLPFGEGRNETVQP